MDHSHHMAGHDMHDMPGHGGGHEMPAMCSMNVRTAPSFPLPPLFFFFAWGKKKQKRLTKKTT